MIERRFHGAGTIDGSHNEVAQALDRANAIRALEFNALVHICLEYRAWYGSDAAQSGNVPHFAALHAQLPSRCR
jgi:hypothetical protein